MAIRSRQRIALAVSVIKELEIVNQQSEKHPNRDSAFAPDGFRRSFAAPLANRRCSTN
jgi:hypothetical protein